MFYLCCSLVIPIFMALFVCLSISLSLSLSLSQWPNIAVSHVVNKWEIILFLNGPSITGSLNVTQHPPATSAAIYPHTDCPIWTGWRPTWASIRREFEEKVCVCVCGRRGGNRERERVRKERSRRWRRRWMEGEFWYCLDYARISMSPHRLAHFDGKAADMGFD